MTKPSIIKGWDISKEDYIKAHQKNELVKLVIDLSNICNLSCPGCFTKRVGDEWSSKSKKRNPNEISFDNQSYLIKEAKGLGAKSVDIVGAGEPTLDPLFERVIEEVNSQDIHLIVFSHGVTKNFNDLEKYQDKNISFFIKLWSQNPELQNKYVEGSIQNYSEKRDKTIERLIGFGFNKGVEKRVDGIDYKTTRIGADILVMKSNYNEVPNLFRFCRNNNIMPIIKTYIPEGPTRFAQEENSKIYTNKQLQKLKEDEVSPEEFNELREKIIKIDRKEYGIYDMKTFYPQSVKCTQSMASVYVTISGDIKSCVGTHLSHGKYEPNKNLISKFLKERGGLVGFGCVPRIQDSGERGLKIPEKLFKIYSDGIR